MSRFLVGTMVWASAVGMFACSGDDNVDGIMAGPAFDNAGSGDGSGGSGPMGDLNGDGILDDRDVPEGACPEGAARTSRVIPRVVLVLDGSCSMSTPYGRGGMSSSICTADQGTRWAELRRVLLDPQNGIVTRLEGFVEFGLVIFGTQPTCPIPGQPIDPVLNNRAAIEAAFPMAPPGMFTPTGAALDWVYRNMIRGEVLDFAQGPEIVLLATDGEPNSCDNPMTNYGPPVDALNFSRQMQVTTYVVSLANSTGEFHDHLQELANIGVGGTGKLYEPTTPEQLAADLEVLIGGAVGCDLTLNGEVRPGMECGARVMLNGRSLECNTDWVLADPRHIRLQEPLCSQFKESADAQFSASFPCGSFRPD